MILSIKIILVCIVLKMSGVVAPDTGVTNYLPVEIAAPHGSQSANMQVRIINLDLLKITFIFLGFCSD